MMDCSNSLTYHNLTLLNWNAAGIPTRINLLADFLSRHVVHVACITETHLTANDRLRVPGYAVYRTDQETRRGGVAILVRRQLQHSQLFLPCLQNLQAAGITLTLTDNSHLNILAGYHRPGLRLVEADFQALFTGAPTILLGDFNSKSPIWGCRTQNSNGIRLERISSNLGLHISVPDEPTYFPTQDRYLPDILDIAILHNVRCPLYHDTITDLDSDHLPVLCTFRATPSRSEPPPKLLNGKVDWELFQLAMTLLDVPLSYETTDDIDAAAREFTEHIYSSIGDSTLRPHLSRTQSQGPKTPSFILDLIHEKNLIRKRWQRRRDRRDKNKLNRLSRQIRHLLEEERYESYRSHVASLDTQDNSLWRETKRILGKHHTIPILHTNGQTDKNATCLLTTYSLNSPH